jgi:hypothetical protein
MQMKVLKLCGGGYSRPSKIKPLVMQSAERSPSYTTKIQQTSQLNVVMPRISIGSGGRTRSILNCLTDSMTIGRHLRISRKPVVYCA